MGNEKSFFQSNKNSILVILLVIAVVVAGFSYFYSIVLKITPTASQTPTSPETTLPTEPTPSSVSGCSCGWNNNYECGGILECKLPSGENSWEKICECNPSGCGPEKGATCGGFSEGILACTLNTC